MLNLTFDQLTIIKFLNEKEWHNNMEEFNRLLNIGDTYSLDYLKELFKTDPFTEEAIDNLVGKVITLMDGTTHLVEAKYKYESITLYKLSGMDSLVTYSKFGYARSLPLTILEIKEPDLTINTIGINQDLLPITLD